MLDTGSGPNIIKENFVPKGKTINYNNILKLSGINEYPVYTLGEITLTIFEKNVIFHVVSNNFPISQSGILGNDFFKQTSSKINYAKECLDISGINVPFFSPETIVAPPRSESTFYIRVENPEIKIGYLPKLKIAHGIYSKETIVENISGKAYFKIISTLDEEVEVQVPTLRLKSLNEIFNDPEADNETQRHREEAHYKKFNKNNEEEPETNNNKDDKNNGNYDANSDNDEDGIINEYKKAIKEEKK
jgi:hypothetical protein